jgi:hypothetical protein
MWLPLPSPWRQCNAEAMLPALLLADCTGYCPLSTVITLESPDKGPMLIMLRTIR